MTSLGSGYIDRTGALVIPATLRDARPFHGGLALAKPFGGWSYGFLGRDGRWVVEPTIAAYQDWSEGVAAFNVGGEVDDEGDVIGGAWGLVADGRVLVPPSLDDVGGCGHGLIPFREGDRWGYLDRAGAVAIPPRFQDADDFSADGLAVVTEDDRDGYLRPDGTWAAPPRFDRLAPASEGLGRARIGDAWHLIDLSGELRSPGFDELRAFRGGIARVSRDGRIGHIGRDGRLLGGGWFEEGLAYDGLVPVRRRDEWFLVDAHGDVHGPYERALPPTEGLARFVRGGKVGFLAADGAVRVPPRYDNARGFHEGRAAVELDGLWTYLDATGAELHPPYWHRAGNFHDGLATVRYGARAGCVAPTGHTAIPLEWDVIERFSDGLAAARKLAWRPVGPPPPGWRASPPAGLASPALAGAGADDALRLRLGFDREVVEDEALRVRHALDSWAAVADAHAGGDALDDVALSPGELAVELAGVPYPLELLVVLIGELADLGAPVAELAVERIRGTDEHAVPTT